jgi:hypothetical protein
LSGYLLYYVGNEHTRALLSTMHWVLGVFAPLAYVLHRLARRKSAITPMGRDSFRRRRHQRSGD